MNTLIKTAFASAAALTALTATVPAYADDQPILVEPAAAMQAWTEETETLLDRRLAGALRGSEINPVSGIVQVRFAVDADGQARELEFYRSSGNRLTDRVAARAVRALGNLAEVPVRNPQAQTFQANIIFAKDEGEREYLAKKLAKYEAKRLALGDSEGSVVLLGG